VSVEQENTADLRRSRDCDPFRNLLLSDDGNREPRLHARNENEGHKSEIQPSKPRSKADWTNREARRDDVAPGSSRAYVAQSVRFGLLREIP